MGFSVSGSAAIIFIGLIVAAGIAVPPLVSSFGELASAHGEQTDRGIDAMNTDIEIDRVEYDNDGDELKLGVENTGSTSLSVADTTVLVDGQPPENEDITTEINDDTDAELWLPGETLNATIEGVGSEPDRLKVITENGVAETENEVDG